MYYPDSIQSGRFLHGSGSGASLSLMSFLSCLKQEVLTPDVYGNETDFTLNFVTLGVPDYVSLSVLSESDLIRYPCTTFSDVFKKKIPPIFMVKKRDPSRISGEIDHVWQIQTDQKFPDRYSSTIGARPCGQKVCI
ncbi:hypothetical protein Tco_0012103 [Tanacetum coccineum]